MTREQAERLSPELAKLHPDAAGPKPSKYKNKRAEYAGVLYASRAEAAYAARLDAAVAAGLVRFWVGQPVFRLGCPENVYRADMLVVPMQGHVYVTEIKGCWTLKAKRDMRLWRKYGPCPLHVVMRGKTEVVNPCGPGPARTGVTPTDPEGGG